MSKQINTVSQIYNLSAAVQTGFSVVFVATAIGFCSGLCYGCRHIRITCPTATNNYSFHRIIEFHNSV